MSKVTLRRALCLLMAVSLVLGPATAIAQDPIVIDYSKGKSHFPNLFGPYSARPMPLSNFRDSTRLEDLIRDGTLYISLQDAIYLTLENNLDIAAQRFGPAIAQTDLLSARGGTIAGGFTRDPILTSGLSINRQNQQTTVTGFDSSGNPQDVIIRTGTNSAQANFTYTQGFATGTQLTIRSNNNRFKTTRQSSPNPAIGTTLSVFFTQPLLNGAGFAQNLLQIRVANNNVKVSNQQFAQQVMDIVSNVKRSYWELIFARDNTKVAEQSLALAEKLYQDNQRQVEIGTLAPLELVRAEAEVARTRQALIAAQTNAFQQETILKDMLSRNPGDPLLFTVTVEPIERPGIPTTTEIIPVQDAIQIAMEKRPEIAQQQISLKNLRLQKRSAQQALKPSVNLFAGWTNTGVAGNRSICTQFDPITNACTQTQLVEEGFNQSATQTLHGDNPNYSFGFNITIPFRNRQGQAQAARAQIEEHRAQVQYKRLVNSVIVDVRNAQIALQQSRAQIDASVKARELQEATLNAEQKRFQLGASTIFLVIQAQRDLALARSTEIRSLVDYQRALVDFDRALGRTLEQSHISLQEAKTGFVTAGVSRIDPSTPDN